MVTLVFSLTLVAFLSFTFGMMVGDDRARARFNRELARLKQIFDDDITTLKIESERNWHELRATVLGLTDDRPLHPRNVVMLKNKKGPN